MAPIPRVPIELTRGPFTIEVARRHGVTRAQLLGASWRRLGVGLYAWREIADAPITRLIAAKHRLPDTAVFTGPTAAWLHGLDMTPPPESSDRRRVSNSQFHSGRRTQNAGGRRIGRAALVSPT